MKKIALFIVISAMLLVLVACTSEQGEGSTSASSASPVEVSASESADDNEASSGVDETTTGANTASASSADNSDVANNDTNTLLISAGGTKLEATLEDNVATAELVALLQQGPITVNLHEYGGFEMIGGLPQSLPTADEQISTSTGDIVLYQGKQISFFYASNSWSYTRLGHIDGYDSAALLEALGGPYDSTVELSLKE